VLPPPGMALSCQPGSGHLPGPGKMDQIEAKSGFMLIGRKKDAHRGLYRDFDKARQPI